MKDNKKSIIEEALAEFTLIEETLNSNAKEILRSVAKEEITSTLNESLHEDEYDIEDIEDVDSDVDALPVDDAPEATPEFGGEESGSEELGLDDIGIEAGEEDLGLGAEEGSEDYGIDMTSASDEEVISVYKKLSGEDEIEVVSSDEVIIKDPSGSEYNVKFNGGGDSLIDQGELGVDGDFSPEAEVAPEVEPEVAPEADFAPEVEPEAEVEAPVAEPEAEFGAEEGGEEVEDEDEDELGEAVVYEIELSEEDEIAEDIIRTKGHDKELVNTAAPNTGDIEGQKAPEDSDSGDNLEGGFDDDAQNGSGDNHAQHIMETKPENHADHVMEKDDVNEDEELNEADEADVNETEEVTETEEITESTEEVTESEEEISEEVVEESEEVIDEEIVEEEETIEEHIPKGKGEAHRMPAKADIGQPVAPGAKGVKGVKGESVQSKKLVETIKKYNSLLAEAKAYKKENETFKTSLKGFRKTITETAIFSMNLTHATKLFLEHSTTSEEKKNILSRFDDEVSTMEESKKLYKRINSELGNQTPITESVENKLMSEQTSGQSSQINETVAYVDPAQKRVLDLIRRTK
jgi:hypothetical protein